MEQRRGEAETSAASAVHPWEKVLKIFNVLNLLGMAGIFVK
jgi:hypothetical protein